MNDIEKKERLQSFDDSLDGDDRTSQPLLESQDAFLVEKYDRISVLGSWSVYCMVALLLVNVSLLGVNCMMMKRGGDHPFTAQCKILLGSNRWMEANENSTCIRGSKVRHQETVRDWSL